MSSTEQQEKKMLCGEIGWDVDAHVRFIHALCRADEFKMAMDACDMLPGFYRDNVPKEIQELKRDIHANFMTAHDYVINPYDTPTLSIERGKQIIDVAERGQVLLKKVKEYNAAGKVPHLVDMGPGDFWMSLGLHAYDCKFTYFGLCVNLEANKLFNQTLPNVWQDVAKADQPVIFIACEILEHLHFPAEILQTYHKYADNADHILLSTPLYTFGTGNDKWREQKWLGHLRTYTPNEFSQWALGTFPRKYQWTFLACPAMVLMGDRING